MSAAAGRTTTGKVWHVVVAAPRLGADHFDFWPLCGMTKTPLSATRDLADVPAYRLCQRCERAVEQIAAAVREVQS